MHNLLVPQTKKNRHEDRLIPLINIVFLLLIFFMVAGQMKSPQAIQLQLPKSNHAKTAAPQALKVLINARGELFIAAQPSSPEQLRQQLIGNAHHHVSLYVDRTLSAKQLNTVLSILREQPNIQVSLHSKAND